MKVRLRCPPQHMEFTSVMVLKNKQIKPPKSKTNNKKQLYTDLVLFI